MKSKHRPSKPRQKNEQPKPSLKDAIATTYRAHGLEHPIRPFPIADVISGRHIFAPPRRPLPPIRHDDLPHAETALSICDQIRRLRDEALAGDEDAVKWLGWLLSQGVADFGEIARRKPDLIRVWSRGQNVVPVLTGKNVAHREMLEADLNTFDVGADSPYKINPGTSRGKKSFNADTPINRLAGALCAHLSQYQQSNPLLWPAPVTKWALLASKLPPLSKTSAKRWTDAAWEALLSATGSYPEKYVESGDCRESEGQGAQREKIRQSLREAIERIAREDNTIIPSKT